MKKPINVLLLVCILAGVSLLTVGYVMGAERTLYIGKTPIHLMGRFDNNEKASARTSSKRTQALEEQIVSTVVRELEEHSVSDAMVRTGTRVASDVIGELEERITSDVMAKLDAYSFSSSEEAGYITIDEMELEAFKNIDIDVIGMDVFIMPGTSYGIEMKYADHRDIVWQNRNGTISVEDKTKNTISIVQNIVVREDEFVIIYCPADVLKDISASSVSGDIQCHGISSDDIALGSVSGDVSLSVGAFEEASLNTVSGEITIAMLSSTELALKTVSGDIEASDSQTDALKMSTTSGDFDIINCIAESSKITTVSGQIDYETELAQDDFSIAYSSTSGSVSLNGEKIKKYSGQRNKNAPYELSVSTVSGGLNMQFN